MACSNYSLTYYPYDLPIDLYVRYSLCDDASTVTQLIGGLPTIDNGDGTYTTAICVSDVGFYPSPVCVQGGLEVTCPAGINWVYEGACSSPSTPTPTPSITASPTPTNPYGCFDLTFISANTITTVCLSDPYPYEYEVWRISYAGGVVNQNVNVLWQWFINDPCGSGGVFETYATIPSGSSYVDIAIDTSTFIDCPPDTSTCYEQTGYMIGIVSADTQCSVLSVTETPTNTPTPTPTPVVSFSHLLFTGNSCSEACDEIGLPITIYTTGSTINIGDHFYLDVALTIDAVMTYYSDGVNCYEYVYSSNGANTAYVGNIAPCFVTQTPTATETPTQTPTNTETPTPTQTTTQTQTPTNTTSQTPTQTQTPTNTATQTNTQTPTSTIGSTPTQTSSNTPTPTPTPTNTETPTSTPTPTNTETPTNTPTETSTPTQTPSETPTNTPTTTPTQTPTAGYVAQLVDCSNNANIFRYYNVPSPLTVGSVYYITGGVEYEGCATVVALTGTGPLYNGLGVSFTQTAAGCADEICPTVSTRAALLYKCSDSSVFYATVKEDTSFPGAVYLYNGECYSFVEFSGPGGPDLGDPDYADCVSCKPTPTPTGTPQSTPTNTPTVSVTPSACTYNHFCFYTTLPSLSGYNGNYIMAGQYNSKDFYVGDMDPAKVVYYTGNYWCLSSSLGGSCVLRGASPCYSQCPDISANDFFGGICPTPTPTPIDCSTFNFNAYFDCDWEPLPTPTPSIACDDVDFTIDSIGVTPTPTPSGNFCNGVAIDFSISGYTPVTPTVTLTPSVTLTRTVSLGGTVTFEMLDETFSCVSVKVLTDCQSGEEFYTTDSLSFSGTPVILGMTMFVQVNGVERCVVYSRDDKNFSSNSNLGDIVQIYSSCEFCSTIPTPTPTITSTPTNTPSPTSSLTPSATPTQTATPSQTATIGSTPPPTPSQTRTATATNTPTPSVTASPSATPNYVYVYQSCGPISPNLVPTQVIQTQKVSFVSDVNITFKDSSNNCWYYVGRFDSTYIAPISVVSITYNGNFFDGAPTTTYPDCETCQVQVFDICQQYNYFNAQRCDNGQSIVVKACYIPPSDITFNTFQFGFAGSYTQQLDLNIKVGDYAYVSDPSGDFCILILSTASQQNTTYIAGSLAFTPISNCSSCPVYRTYTANSCDGTEQNITIYDLATAPQLAIGTVVSIIPNTVCYIITAYNGLIANVWASPTLSNFVSSTFVDCPTCIGSFNTTGGDTGGGGGGGGGS